MYMHIYISLNKRHMFPKNIGDQLSEMVSGVLGWDAQHMVHQGGLLIVDQPGIRQGL